MTPPPKEKTKYLKHTFFWVGGWVGFGFVPLDHIRWYSKITPGSILGVTPSCVPDIEPARWLQAKYLHPSHYTIQPTCFVLGPYLIVYVGNTPGSASGVSVNTALRTPGIEPGLTAFKASTLTPVISLVSHTLNLHSKPKLTHILYPVNFPVYLIHPVYPFENA